MSTIPSIDLENLNVDIRNKLAKFNTSNSGKLTNEELLQAVITLQKQSNNYKRLIYMMIPVMIFMIASIFGTTILAINLTKDLKINSNGLLVGTNNNEVISTSVAVNYSSLHDWLSSENTNALKEIHALEFRNMILPVQHVYVNSLNSTTTFVLDHMYMIIDFMNQNVDISVKKLYENDIIINQMVQDLQQQLKEVKLSQKMATNYPHSQPNIKLFDILLQLLGIGVQTKPQPTPLPCGAVKPACSPKGICSK